MGRGLMNVETRDAPNPAEITREAQEQEKAYLDSLDKKIPAEMTTIKESEIFDKTVYHGPGEEGLRQLREKAERIVDKRFADIKVRYTGLISRLRELNEEKLDLQRQPLTKQDLLREAKETLTKHREHFMVHEFLLPHFKECQKGQALVFSEAGLKRTAIHPDDIWMLLFYIMSEAQIEEAINLLPDIGISEKERARKVKQIDKQMAEIQAVLDTEFAELEIPDEEKSGKK